MTDAAIEEKITVVNATSYPIRVVRITSSTEGQEAVRAEMGPIAKGEQASTTIRAWRSGSFVVEADVEKEGKTETSRPFTADLKATEPGVPITPVTLTLGVIAETWFAWQEVRWDPPEER